MIIHEEADKNVVQVSIAGRPPQAMRQRLVTHKICEDKDIVELTKEMAKGRDIIINAPGTDCTYIMVREWIPSKIALGELPNEL
jgi:hypothetical protein